MLTRTLGVMFWCRIVTPHKALMINTYISCRQNHSPVYFEDLGVIHLGGCVKQLSLKFTL